ncbi:MAG: hypothetical protein H7Y43_11130 [Akkermansiaceae bacterium]|nr:hypothetical protein [Verrucomicrobiales bacterium]
MNTNLIRSLLAVCLALSATSASAMDTNSAASGSPTGKPLEDFGYDVHEGVSNRITRIAMVDPRFIWVIYEDGVSGRKIPRADLPSKLQARYPYDPQKAADSIKARTAENQALKAQHKHALQQKERALVAQIEALDKQRTDNEKEIGNLNRKLNTAPRSKVLKHEKLKVLDEQNNLRERRTALDARLKQVRAQLDSLK